MKRSNRLAPIQAAKQIVKKRYPHAHAAILAGSVVRGEATATSDLDIVIFDDHLTSSYRTSFIDFDWHVEAFVHSFTSYKTFFDMDYERAKPSLLNMLAEGIILRHDDRLQPIKAHAEQLLAQGPKRWTEATINLKRYMITDMLDDFIGCTNTYEELFIVNQLAELVSEFILRVNGQWVGTSKWTFRLLKAHDEQQAEQFFTAFNTYYETKKKAPVILFVEQVLAPYGGRLFDGFTMK